MFKVFSLLNFLANSFRLSLQQSDSRILLSWLWTRTVGWFIKIWWLVKTLFSSLDFFCGNLGCFTYQGMQSCILYIIYKICLFFVKYLTFTMDPIAWSVCFYFFCCRLFCDQVQRADYVIICFLHDHNVCLIYTEGDTISNAEIHRYFLVLE